MLIYLFSDKYTNNGSILERQIKKTEMQKRIWVHPNSSNFILYFIIFLYSQNTFWEKVCHIYYALYCTKIKFYH